ncbi:MAG TPA: hypothetical protein VE197_08135 [Mycobacterium sp.]|jgi:hypothetical protein|nr:hypothetical protein [Mycobacterium sp.]
MNDEELHKAMFDLMQSYFNDIDQPRPASQIDFENGDVVHISENTNRALQTHKTALDGANEWLRARLADDGLELVDQG